MWCGRTPNTTPKTRQDKQQNVVLSLQCFLFLFLFLLGVFPKIKNNKLFIILFLLLKIITKVVWMCGCRVAQMHHPQDTQHTTHTATPVPQDAQKRSGETNVIPFTSYC